MAVWEGKGGYRLWRFVSDLQGHQGWCGSPIMGEELALGEGLLGYGLAGTQIARHFCTVSVGKADHGNLMEFLLKRAMDAVEVQVLDCES